MKIEFTNRQISPYGGLSLMVEMLEKIKFNDVLDNIGLPKQGSNRGYSPNQLIQSFFLGLWAGANRFEHLELLRGDHVLRQMFDWKQMAGHRAYKRYFDKFSQSINQRVFDDLFHWIFSNTHVERLTLDFDSTIITRYGEQEGAKVGYNPKKPGRNSHHPLLAFVSELRMVANHWLRPGNTASSSNFVAFFQDTMHKLRSKKIGLVRADSGFFTNEILSLLESPEYGVNYVIAAKFYQPIKKIMAEDRKWVPLGKGIEISDGVYRAKGWKANRRLVMVRQNVAIRPKAVGKQLRLFGDSETYKNWRYSCFITNLDMSAEMVYDMYRNRADAENRIKELKEDFGYSSFVSQKFWSSEAALNFVAIAYNLLSLFRLAVLKSQHQQFLKTIRYKLFSVGAFVVKRGNQKILKLSLDMSRRKWIMGVFSSTKLMSWPFVLKK